MSMIIEMSIKQRYNIYHGPHMHMYTNLFLKEQAEWTKDVFLN
jgi:hypothetical protein